MLLITIILQRAGLRWKKEFYEDGLAEGLERGRAEGEEKGELQGIVLAKKVFALAGQKLSAKEIAKELTAVPAGAPLHFEKRMSEGRVSFSGRRAVPRL